MKKYTVTPGTRCHHLVSPDGFHLARSFGNFPGDDDQLNTLAADLNELALLRESCAELEHILSRHHEAQRAVRSLPAPYLISDLGKNTAHVLERAQALLSPVKPHSGDSQSKETPTT